MQLSTVMELVAAFGNKVLQLKQSRTDVPWYPYGSFANVQHFDNFQGLGRDLFADIGPGKKVIDIGAGDGDMAFFLESLGTQVTILDNPASNLNNCRGILEMHAMLLRSAAGLQFIDLDWAPVLPGQYDLAFFLGILYHLRSPALVLNSLANCSQRMLMSTPVFFRLGNGMDVENLQLAYFIDRREFNNDSTNYWFFSPAALRALLRRSGWRILDEFFTGTNKAVTPESGESRMFCYCERVPNWQDLRVHHDF
jgi:tRNA (mo5U34)-methyltransferase